MKAINKEAILNLPYPYNLSSNGTTYGDKFGCSSQYSYYNTYQVFNDVPQSFSNLGNNIIWYYPTSANLTQIQIRLTTSGTTPRVSGYIQVLQGSTWTNVQSYSASGSLTTINLSISGYYKTYRITFSNPASYDNMSFSSIVGTYKGTSTDLIPQTTRKYYKYTETPFVQPTLTWDGLIGNDYFAVATGHAYSSRDIYRAFDNVASTYSDDYGAGAGNFWQEFYFNNPTRITNLEYIPYTSTGLTWTTAATVQYSDDGSTWTDATTITRQSATGTNTWDISSSTTNQFHKYWRVYCAARSVIAQINITATQKVVTEGTSSDYDYYLDLDEYKVVA